MGKKAIDPICGMSVDTSTGLHVEYEGKQVYFCSQHCKMKYMKEQGIVEENKTIQHDHSETTCCSTKKHKPVWKQRLFWILVAYAVIFTGGMVHPLIGRLSMALEMYLQSIILALIIGFLIGGIIDWLVPREYISKLLSQPKKLTIVYAVIMGFFMSACSHGILALSIQLYKKGASPAAVVAFLLSSPWANIPLTILMFSFFGVKALLIVLSAIIIALITGMIYLYLQYQGWVETNPNTADIDSDFSIRGDIRQRLADTNWNGDLVVRGFKGIWAGAVSLMGMVLWWILLGILLASIASAYLPPDFIQQYMGASVLGLLATLVAATILEICSEGTAPLAFEIYRQTGAFGNSFVFLMAGVVTDYTEIGLLWTNIGRKTALWLPVIAVPQVLLLAVLFNVYLS